MVAKFSRDSLTLNESAEVERIVAYLRDQILTRSHRKGAVVGISGGVDSALVLALCARALGPGRVLGVALPERDSSPESEDFAFLAARMFQVPMITEDLTAALDGLGCYRRRDEAVRRVFPAYEEGWKVRIVLPGDLLEQDTLNIFSLVVTDPHGTEHRKRLPLNEYAQIVAATNFKQRMRMSMLYYQAEVRNYAVIGSPNRAEHELGFFVKWGDGAYDAAPIRHLFKSQIYQLARYLEIPVQILERTPTTDTYPGAGSQQEFFFRIPLELLDMIWHGTEMGFSAEEMGEVLSLTPVQVQRVIDDIQRKQRTTAFLRSIPEGYSPSA